MDQIEEKTTEIAIAYEPDYTIEDKAFFEPFVVMRAIGQGLPAWWADRLKVQNLINAFKMDLTVHEACIMAGISKNQYVYFCKIHPAFLSIKGRLKGVLGISAKQGLVADIINPEGFRSRQWYLERKQPHIYGRDIGAYTPPPAEAASKVTAEAFLDKDGNMILGRKTQEILKKEHGNTDNNGGE